MQQETEVKVPAKPPVSHNFKINAYRERKRMKSLFTVINSSTIIPILEDVKISGHGNKLRFTCTDLETTVYYDIDSYLGDFELCVKAHHIRQLIRNAIDEELHFRTFVEKKTNYEKIKIRSGDFSYTTILDDAKEFPKIPIIVGESKYKCMSQDIGHVLKNALLFVSNDDLRPALMGILMCDYKNQLHIVATDANRLFWYPLVKTPECFKGKRLILPQKGVRLMLETFRSEEIEMTFNDLYAKFESEDKGVFLRLIDQRYPGFDQIIPKYELSFYVIRKRMVAFLKLAEAFVNRGTKEIKITVSETTMNVFGGDPYFNNSLEFNLQVFNSTVKFQAFTFVVNLKYLQSLLTVNNDEYVKISHSGSSKSAVIFDDCILIMPLYLNP